MVAHFLHTEGVTGSSPVSPIDLCEITLCQITSNLLGAPNWKRATRYEWKKHFFPLSLPPSFPQCFLKAYAKAIAVVIPTGHRRYSYLLLPSREPRAPEELSAIMHTRSVSAGDTLTPLGAAG